jgi:DNA invertase Pin-like site-specific DNA recombinase
MNPRRVGIYVRVSTGEQTTASQRRELEAWAGRAGHTIVEVYEDHGISGAKGRDKRPAFDALLKAAVRREIDMIAVWASDRLGRSLSHLVEVLQTIRDTGTGLYIHTQAVDTTTPAGRALFGMLGVFAEFEREMIAARVNAGLARAKEALSRDGQFKARSGKVRTRLGRPAAEHAKIEAARHELARGPGSARRHASSGSAPAPCTRSSGRWSWGEARRTGLPGVTASTGNARLRARGHDLGNSIHQGRSRPILGSAAFRAFLPQAQQPAAALCQKET